MTDCVCKVCGKVIDVKSDKPISIVDLITEETIHYHVECYRKRLDF